jgi:hypothetical protein
MLYVCEKYQNDGNLSVGVRNLQLEVLVRFDAVQFDKCQCVFIVFIISAVLPYREYTTHVLNQTRVKAVINSRSEFTRPDCYLWGPS